MASLVKSFFRISFSFIALCGLLLSVFSFLRIVFEAVLFCSSSLVMCSMWVRTFSIDLMTKVAATIMDGLRGFFLVVARGGK